MAGQLVGGAALGALFGESLTQAIELVNKARKFKTTREELRSTLQHLIPLLQQMKAFDERLDRPLDQIERVMKEFEEADKLVHKCSKVPWYNKYWAMPSLHDKLQKREKKLERAVSVDVQLRMAVDVKEILSDVKEVLQNNFGLSTILRGVCEAPENPEYTVGLDGPLKETKIELLKDGVSVLVLTGLPGSGKTTMAKKLCWDPDVRRKFGNYIFFVTFSKTPNLKSIVQTLFEHRGLRVPEFSSDEVAIHRLEYLLRQLGKNPILLVLDDVWRGSETLVEKFKLKLSDYKVLVTSRFEFPRFDFSCRLEPLGHDDAVKLFRHFSLPNDSASYKPDEELVHQVVKGCKGSPLAIGVIGGLLCKQPFERWQRKVKEWSQGQSILDSNADLLNFLKKSLDVLEDDPIVKECFMDLGLFPEDQKIPVTALVDMWAELYNLDGDGIEAMDIIHELTASNLAKTVVRRKVARDTDKYYNNHSVVLHDLLRDLAIRPSNQVPFEERSRLIVDSSENDHLELCPEQEQQVIARTLSIYADETSIADWCNLQPDQVEVLVLNLRSSNYTLPEFTGKMRKLKVLIVTNYGFHLSKLNKFELLSSLSGLKLKRIRLEKVSVPCLCPLVNLQKLSLHMCNTRQAFESCSVNISDALPNLLELSIDYCKDLEELPAGICKISPLKKLSITNCHKFSALPQELEELENLDFLRLSSCTSLGELPDSISKLPNLSHLDISECISLNKLPDDFGDLHTLEKLYMRGCSGCDLPDSVIELKHLKGVICDEETAASWERFQPKLPDLSIEVLKADINLDWLDVVGS